MAKLTPYNLKIRVYCENDDEARKVQQSLQEISSSVNIIGSETLNFYAYYKRNEGVLRPAILDVMKNGVKAISRHILTLTKLK